MAQYQRKKTQLTGIKKLNTGEGRLGNGQLTLDQMNLDRKADFEGDTFDPFKIGMGMGSHDLQLQAQNANFDMANSKGNQLWTPEQL